VGRQQGEGEGGSDGDRPRPLPLYLPPLHSLPLAPLHISIPILCINFDFVYRSIAHSLCVCVCVCVFSAHRRSMNYWQDSMERIVFSPLQFLCNNGIRFVPFLLLHVYSTLCFAFLPPSLPPSPPCRHHPHNNNNNNTTKKEIKQQ